MLLCLTGQTAVGKSRLSLKISRIIDTPVISADSMQIYKGFDIGTAKPAPEELAETKHYMINIAEPEDYFSSYDYAQQAESIISDLETENKIPFISGGTGFYIETLLFPNDFDNSVDFEYRKELDSLLRTYGKDALVKMLQETDPKTAEKIHPNNTKQIIRALEIFKTTGKRKSEGSVKRKPKFEYVLFQLTMPREKLYERINERVDLMIKKGLTEEVYGLYKRIDKNSQSMQGIGYKELVSYFEGECTLSEAIENIKLNTRHYAKRQETFFKRLDPIILDTENGDDKNIDIILKELDKKQKEIE